MGRFLLTILFLTSSKSVLASSCCGQSPSSFTVLALEQRLSVNTSYSFLNSAGRIFNSDEFYIWEEKERVVQSLQFNVASAFASRHQVFLNTSILQGRYQDEFETGSSQNMSDTQIGYTYELLPEYSFSYWKPLVYVSAIVNLPTGNSIYDESSLSEGTDVTGHNQWGAGLGLTLRKVYFPLTITFQAKTLRVFSKQFSDVEVSNFYDNSLALLFNYALNFQQMALNFGVTMNQLTAREISTSDVASGEMLNTTLLFGLQKVFSDSWSVGINYADQTLLGPAKNSILNQTYNFNINYNYF